MAEETQALATAAGPVLHAATRRILSEHFYGHQGPNPPAGQESRDGTPQPAERDTRSSVIPGRPDRRIASADKDRLLVRDVVSLVGVQSRAIIRRELEARGLDAAGLRLFDAAELSAEHDDGVARLRAAWTTAGTTAVHLDNAHALPKVPALQSVVASLIRSGPGPRLVVLRRPRSSDAPLPSQLLGREGTRFTREHEEHTHETAPVRMFRLVLGDLGAAPVDFEDRFWKQLTRSRVTREVKRDAFLRTCQEIADAVRERRRKRVGWHTTAPLNVEDLPRDIDAYLRRGI
ncbi:hypothetical protein Asp14428_73630 [Actinoplanes sp. NBRC 14428]|nr:hypothetical protein Asp14428_73630 [Actinoplanes sp. NBRC 14428]